MNSIARILTIILSTLSMNASWGRFDITIYTHLQTRKFTVEISKEKPLSTFVTPDARYEIKSSDVDFVIEELVRFSKLEESCADADRNTRVIVLKDRQQKNETKLCLFETTEEVTNFLTRLKLVAKRLP